MVLIARQNKAHLIEVIAVERRAVDHPVHDVVGLELVGALHALATGIGPKHRTRGLAEVLTCKQAVVALEIKLEATTVQPVDDMAALVSRDELVHHHLAVALHIAAVAADHAIEADVGDLGRVFGLAAAGAHVHAVSVCARGTDSSHGALGHLVAVIGDGAINIKKDNLGGGHGNSLREKTSYMETGRDSSDKPSG